MAKKKPKQYRIRTIEDITDMITFDNASDFLKDFRKILSKWLYVKTLNPKAKLKLREFTWIQDGENNIDIKVVPLKKKKK